MAVKAISTPLGLERLEGDWPEQGQWTYADYRRLRDDGWRYEVIEGEMLTTPAPKTIHQKSQALLDTAMINFATEHDRGEV